MAEYPLLLQMKLFSHLTQIVQLPFPDSPFFIFCMRYTTHGQ
jgi:hypothetical protein